MTSRRDDHIYRFTRLLSIFIIPFLIVAWIILYLLPQRSGELFAWPVLIRPAYPRGFSAGDWGDF